MPWPELRPSRRPSAGRASDSGSSRPRTVLDLTTVQGITMLITVIALVANLGTDFFYAYLDPRVRLH